MQTGVEQTCCRCTPFSVATMVARSEGVPCSYHSWLIFVILLIFLPPPFYFAVVRACTANQTSLPASHSAFGAGQAWPAGREIGDVATPAAGVCCRYFGKFPSFGGCCFFGRDPSRREQQTTGLPVLAGPLNNVDNSQSAE